ncbi:MAG TPA: alkaline phosphatase family protein, partial [Acidimicrobiales bacterium]|nr:alkaline phosphatase family protein [Acidimicrobiales bacterium]
HATMPGMQERLDRLSGRRRLRHRDAAGDLSRLPDPTLPPGSDRLPQIKHIVLLMMENHSFDNYFGRLGRGDGLSDPPQENPRRSGPPVAAFHFDKTTQTPEVPSQSWRSSHLQFDDGRNDGFVTSIEEVTPNADATLGMGYWTDTDLPFYAGLARTFPLADRWFCSCLGPTFPNRRFLMAATANGLIDDIIAGIVDYPRSGTIFDLLNRYGISWANYHHVPHSRLLRKRFLGGGFLRLTRGLKLAAGHLLPFVEHRVRGEIDCTANLYPLGFTRTIGHLRHIDRFFKHAAEGTLPAVSIVDPDFTACSEENPQDVQIGEGFAASVINAVMHGKAWANTVLIWFYDEHGGYYDHVPPPAAVEPDDVEPHSLLETRGPWRWLVKHTPMWRTAKKVDTTSGLYDRYGFRVPAVVVSPYAKPDLVSSTVFDHTSALKLIEEKWNLPPLTKRDAAADAPWDMLDFNSEPAFLDPPSLPPPAVRWRL